MEIKNMNLELIKNDETKKIDLPKSKEKNELEFVLFKNMIQKDMDVSFWINDLSSHFNEISIYSEFGAELNSFEHIVSYLTGAEIDFENNTFEIEILNRCYENFFCIMFSEIAKHGTVKTELLAHDFTNYTLEAIELRKYPREIADKLLFDLDLKYFGGRYNAQSRKINPKYL
jgi:hypothetical protein